MKLKTERCRKLYKRRGKTVEPVFGQIKEVRHCERFMRRGYDACRSEWSLICATHNLLKLWVAGGRADPAGSEDKADGDSTACPASTRRPGVRQAA